MARRIPEVDEATAAQQYDAVPVWEDELVHLWLDVVLLDARPLLQLRDLDLVVEVPDVADYRLILHLAHVLRRDDVAVACARDEDVGIRDDVIDGLDLVALHRCLQRAYRVYLSDDDSRSEAPHALCTALADVAVATDADDLAGYHDVRAPLDAVRKALTTAIQVVELALRHRVVDVDGREQQLALLHHLVESVHSRRRLL